MGLRGVEAFPSASLVPCLPLKAGKIQSLGQTAVERLLSSSRAEPSGRFHGRVTQVTAQLFRPPIFDPRKLTTTFLPGASGTEPQPPAPRRYTLTHNDITGQLSLSIGCNYNTAQVSDWYTRLIRDEVLAEWCFPSKGHASLHVYCHVSGEERWLAPPALRNYIFQREMPLVLDTILHADRALLQQSPCLAEAAVVVHLSSHLTDLNMSVKWGTLSERASWPASETTLLQMLWRSLVSRPQPASPAELQQLASLSDSITEQLEQSSASVLTPAGVAGRLSRQKAEVPSQSLLLGVNARGDFSDRLPQQLDGVVAASGESVQVGDICRLLGGESAETAQLAPSVIAADVQLSSARPELQSVGGSSSADASSRNRSSSGEEAISRDASYMESAGGRGQQRFPKQSETRSSKSTRPGMTFPEGNILEFDHGGCERRAGAVQVVTASNRISEWFASGHEVINVHL